MKYAIVPSAVAVKNPHTGDVDATVTLRMLAMRLWLDDQRWEKPRANLARLMKILPEFEKEPGQIMNFEDADYAILRDIITKPFVDQNGGVKLFQPLVQIQVKSLEDAILDATDAAPPPTAAEPTP